MRKYQSLGWIIGGIILIGIVIYLIWPWIFDGASYPFHRHMIGGWGMPLSMIGMALFWIGVIYMGAYVFGFRADKKQEDAMDILKKRLAQGDLSIEEYELLMRKIKEGE